MIEYPWNTLKKLMDDPLPLIAPGTHDAITARLIEEVGFKAVYISGAGISSSLLGIFDIGLVNQVEVAAIVSNIINSIEIPAIVDADTGYGNEANVWRTVKLLTQAKAAAFHIEDQIFPKKCGYIKGGNLISIEKMVSKIKVAIKTRGVEGPLIIARTETLMASSFDETLDRAISYQEAGADMIFVNGLRNDNEASRLSQVIKIPMVYNVSTSAKTPEIPLEDLSSYGFKLVIYPAQTLMVQLQAAKSFLTELRDENSLIKTKQPRMNFKEWNKLGKMEFFNSIVKGGD